MERVIKFRGKSYCNKQWVYGLLSIDTDLDTCIEGPTYSHEVEADTIGQYIGKKDRNGVEIYEGDILKWHNAILERDIIAKVVWDKLDYGYSARNANNVNYFIPKFMKVEVIGNIHDNPELLK